MKIGLLIKNREASELSVFIEHAPFFYGREDQFYVFAEDIRPNGPKFPFPFMDMREAWEFDGTIITMQPDLAFKLLNFASPEHRAWMIPHPFWHQLPFPADKLFQLLKAYDGHLLFTDKQVKEMVTSTFNLNGILVNNNIFQTIYENLPSTTRSVRLL